MSDVIQSGWISSASSYVTRFEDEFSRFCGARHGVAVTSGTTALHLALAALDIGPGDEVILPVLTHIACLNAVRLVQATPVLVDCSPATWGVDPDAVENAITPRTRAIMVVHLFGHPVDVDPIVAVASARGIAVIEDAAQAHGAEYKGRRAGSLGTAACFSFYANKIITTGEGGMVVTDDDALASRLRKLRDQAYEPDRRFLHREVGFNYRLTGIQGAFGLAQMESLEEFVRIRRQNAVSFNSRLGELVGIGLPPEAPWAKSVYWMYTVLVDPKQFGESSVALGRYLRENGVDSRPLFVPLHQQPAYDGWFAPRSFAVAEHLAAQALSLPSGNELTTYEVARVAVLICDR
ncbi:MAG: DegT/DnrJ/EryC1/StrS family aminotransferase, partial [Acidimicrobiales bacterium]